MVFLELRRDSRGMTGISGFLLDWPWEAQSSSRVARESWGLTGVVLGVYLGAGSGRGEQVTEDRAGSAFSKRSPGLTSVGPG